MRLSNPFRRKDAEPQSLILPILAAAALALLVIKLADVLLLVFAAVLLAMLLHEIARPLRRWAPVGRAAALVIALAVVVGAIGLLIWLFGSQTAQQLSSLSVLLQTSWEALHRRLSGAPLGDVLLDRIREASLPNGVALSWVTHAIGNAASVAVSTIVVAAAAIYMAFNPQAYVRGALLLIPRSHRGRAAEVVEACRYTLSRWMVGQLVSMVFMGAATSIGLWLAGVPSPLALGLLAGIGQLAPVIGPWIAAVPGVLVAAAEGPETLGWALAVYVLSSQLEANLLTPLVLHRMAQLPMAMTLFAVIAMGVLLGPLGVVLATPLSVVAYVLVRKVYLEGALGERLEGPEQRR
jgi:predicted PurR-regulated permease PerM